MQKLRFVRARPENIVVIASSLGAKKNATITRYIGDTKFQTITIEADGLVEITAAEDDVIDQLRCCLFIPITMLIPASTAAGRINLLIPSGQRLTFELTKADRKPEVIGAMQR